MKTYQTFKNIRKFSKIILILILNLICERGNKVIC